MNESLAQARLRLPRLGHRLFDFLRRRQRRAADLCAGSRDQWEMTSLACMILHW
mgnify:CR=1 FL=1